MLRSSLTAHVNSEVRERLLEVLSQSSGLGSAANLDDFTRECLEEDLEEMIAEAHENYDPRARYSPGPLIANLRSQRIRALTQ